MGGGGLTEMAAVTAAVTAEVATEEEEQPRSRTHAVCPFYDVTAGGIFASAPIAVVRDGSSWNGRGDIGPRETKREMWTTC